MKSCEAGMSKESIVNIFVISLDTLNRRTRKCKETGSAEPYKRTKHRERKFSCEALLEHVMKNPSAALEERAHFFSVKHQSVYARMKVLGITRKKTFLYEERDEGKRKEFFADMENEDERRVVYIDESGIKKYIEE